MNFQIPAQDEYVQWLENPVTQFVMSALVATAKDAKEQWTAKAWEDGPIYDPEMLKAIESNRQRIKMRAEAYTDLASLTYEDLLAANGVETPNEP